MENSLYVIVFDISNPEDVKAVPNWMHMVQAKVPVQYMVQSALSKFVTYKNPNPSISCTTYFYLS